MHACYRIQQSSDRRENRKRRGESFRLIDERTGQEAACCDLSIHKIFTTVTIRDGDNKNWQIQPNRKIMPSRWVVTDPRQRIAMQFDQKILAKLVNPICRTILVLLAEDGHEAFRLVNLTSNIGVRLFGVNIGDWVILREDMPVAKLTRLKRSGLRSSGLLGKIKHWLKSSDYAIVSSSEEHVLSAPVALSMYLIFRELYDPSE